MKAIGYILINKVCFISFNCISMGACMLCALVRYMYNVYIL